jgi:hypothetical protein
MPFKFIREDAIKMPRDVVEKRLAGYKQLNYNKFMWWRSHTDGVTPLGKRAPLKDRIINGDFGPSTYFWQAQLALHNAKEKVNLNTDDYQKQLENLAVDLARYKRLMEDHEKEENGRLEALYDAFTSHFQMTRKELEDELCEWTGELLSYYNYCYEFKRTTPAANRKSRRGRPRKT